MRYFEKLFHTVVISMFIGLMSSFAFAADPVKVGFVYVGPIGDTWIICSSLLSIL
jgi:hypothetical protein